MKSNKSTALYLGVLSALFFAVTFVLNRLMSVEGGSWVWSSALRFFWMLPFLLLIVAGKNKLKELFKIMQQNPFAWFFWGTIGFGIFYAPLTFSAAYAPSWLVASTWQVTIIAGVLIAPLLRNKEEDKNMFSFKTLLFSLIILLGIIIMLLSEAKEISLKELLLGVLPVLLAAFAYPLGNRKMMKITNGKLDAFQRVLGMTIGSLPFWMLLSFYELTTSNLPTQTQVFQTLIVAVCSGVIATVLFFTATDRVKHNQKWLAAVEATQSTEVVFALIGEILIFQIHLPNMYVIIGMLLVIVGMVLHSLKS